MNKTLVILIMSLISCTPLFSQSDSETNIPSAKINFTEITHDYGAILQNSDGTCEFKFTNEGQSPLVLSNVRSSCGCTVPEWPRDPINKGENGIIEVKYNTRIVGNFNKSIMVYSNGSKDPVILRIKGSVIKQNPEENN